jgi:hypothetical protein
VVHLSRGNVGSKQTINNWKPQMEGDFSLGMEVLSVEVCQWRDQDLNEKVSKVKKTCRDQNGRRFLGRG